MTAESTGSSLKRRGIALGVVVALGVAGFWLWRTLAPREATDDAQVSGHVNPIASRVGGIVTAVRVTDNQTVKAGDVLVEIDPRDYQLALSRAEADLAVAEAAARAARAGVPIASATAQSTQRVADVGTGNADAAVQAASREVDASRAKVASAHARLIEAQAHARKAAQDVERLTPLAAKDEIPRQQMDAAAAAAHAADAGVTSAEAAVHEAEANLAVAEARRDQASGAAAQARSQATAAATAPQQIALSEARASGADAQVVLARAAVEQARLNLERTIVRAPADGQVSRRGVEAGQVIQPGQPLMAVTSLGDVWVTANFKETQLRSMKPGQRAEVSVDAYGRTYRAHVDSISAATGATFSLLPADNASGNFVKVVQRVPVKIVLDDPRDASAILRPGMSVNATVYMK
jgi:membrane fusion protein (multidrug efflux system)